MGRARFNAIVLNVDGSRDSRVRRTNFSAKPGSKSVRRAPGKRPCAEHTVAARTFCSSSPICPT